MYGLKARAKGKRVKDLRVLYWRRRSLLFWSLVVLAGGLVLGGWLWGAARTVYVTKVVPIYQGDANKKAIALVFNVDWGEEYLPHILELLSQWKVRATFFLTGQWADKFPELVRKVAEAGHEVGNHGYSHLHVNNLSPEEIRRDIKRAEEVLMGLIGRKPALYTPPYGENKPHVIAAATELGYKFILWTINPGDYLPGTKPEDIIKTVISHSQNGAIIQLHPTAATTQALPGIIEGLKKRGYALVTVSEIL